MSSIKAMERERRGMPVCDRNNKIIEKHFNFRRGNMFLLKSLITAVNCEMLLANTTIDTNIDTMLNTFYDTFWPICEKCVPTVTSSRRINTSNYPQHNC